MARRLAEAFVRRDPQRVAAVLESLNDDGEAVALLAELEPSVVVELLRHLSLLHARALLARQPDERLVGWLNALPLDSAVLLLARCQAERQAVLLSAVRPVARRQYLERSVGFPEESVGALTDPNVLTLPDTATVAEALGQLRRQPGDVPGAVLVQTAAGRLAGLLDLNRLVTQGNEAGSIAPCVDAVVPLRAEMTVSAALEQADWTAHLCLPVLDYRDHLLGVVTLTALRSAAGSQQAAQPGLDAVAEVTLRFVDVAGWLLVNLLGGRSREPDRPSR